MATLVSAIRTKVRLRLEEPVAKFWSNEELDDIIIDGTRDLWRDIADLKAEHFMATPEDVVLQANSAVLTNVPVDVHKIIMIAPLDLTSNSANNGLIFKPADFNSDNFQSSLSRSAIDPANDCVYYAITSQGSPVGAPIIRVAPKVNSDVALAFAYVPTLPAMTSGSIVPIPGEADNALVAWGVAFARAKEREDRAPDANWLSIYATEKTHLLQSLGLRQYQEPSFSQALFESYW